MYHESSLAFSKLFVAPVFILIQCILSGDCYLTRESFGREVFNKYNADSIHYWLHAKAQADLRNNGIPIYNPLPCFISVAKQVGGIKYYIRGHGILLRNKGGIQGRGIVNRNSSEEFLCSRTLPTCQQ